jgi:predicted HAD superfamily Cof-like phosphohydrolase
MKRLMHQMIEDFHKKFGVEPKHPIEWNEDDHLFRLNFLREELIEYEEALDRLNYGSEDSQTDMLDALVDLVYVAMGTAYIYGWDFEEAFRRVHEANMQKIRAQSANESKRGSSLDIVKPAGWKPPVLNDLVKEIICE